MTTLKGRYELREKLGEGGMAEVYHAVQLTLDREVAVKFIKSNLTDESFAARFEREAKAVARLSHPNIMHVYDFDQAEDGRYFMVMELLRGAEMATHIRQRQEQNEPFTLEETLRIVRSVAEALYFAHQHDIVHRDIKPHNIFLTDDQRVVVTDFGIAKMLHEGYLTQTGTTIGTPHYFAPEQGSGQAVDYRADIYALGVVFYELLTGHVPYDADSTLGILAQHANAPIPDPRDAYPHLPPATTEIVKRAMAKVPADRYLDMAAFIDDLEALAKDEALGEGTLVLDTPAPTHPAVSAPTPEPPTAIGETPTGPLTTKPGLMQRRELLALAAVGMLLVISVVVALLLFGGGDDDQGTSGEPELPTVDIAPAAAGEYLYVVADFAGDEEAGVDVARRVANILQGSDITGVLGERFRLEQVDQQITSVQEAAALANATGALLVIWGVQDAAGLEIVIQTPRYPERTLRELRYFIPAGDRFNAVLADELPFVLSGSAFLLTQQQLMRDEDFLALTYLGENSPFEQLVGTDLQIVPSTDRERNILEAFTIHDSQAVDTALSNVITLVPDDPSLLFFRLAINLGLQRYERVRADLDRMEAILSPDNAIVIWFRGGLAMIEGDYDSLVTLTEGLSPENASEEMLSVFAGRELALIVLGDYETALAELNALTASGTSAAFPGVEAVRALLYEIVGDEKSAEADRQTVLSSRLLEQAGSMFVDFFTAQPPGGLMLFIGYLTEVYIDPTAALPTYRNALGEEAADYLLLWRIGTALEAQGDVQAAYDAYSTAAESAPLPFPIAPYRAALLLRDHPDEVATSQTACGLLADAHQTASSDPKLYAVLLENITAVQSDLGCE